MNVSHTTANKNHALGSGEAKIRVLAGRKELAQRRACLRLVGPMLRGNVIAPCFVVQTTYHQFDKPNDANKVEEW